MPQQTSRTWTLGDVALALLPVLIAPIVVAGVYPISHVLLCAGELGAVSVPRTASAGDGLSSFIVAPQEVHDGDKGLV